MSPVLFSESVRLWIISAYGRTPQTEISRRTGVSTSVVNGFFRGTRPTVSMETLDALVGGIERAPEVVIQEIVAGGDSVVFNESIRDEIRRVVREELSKGGDERLHRESRPA